MLHLIYDGLDLWKIIVIKGNINLDISKTQIYNLNFYDYFACYKQLPEMEKYYWPENSSIWQMFHEHCPQWVHNLVEKIPQDFKHHVVSAINIPPGQTIPYHQDKHFLLKETYGPGDTWRYLIFLEDWKSGHYFEIYNRAVTGWKSGDWIKFHQKDWHAAANVGIEPFYSVQITVM